MDSIKVIGKSEFIIVLKFPVKSYEGLIKAFSTSHAANQFAIRYFEKHPRSNYIEFDISPITVNKDTLHYCSSRSLDGDIKTDLMI